MHASFLNLWPPRRWRHAGALLLLAPACAWAQSYQVTAYTRANTNDFLGNVGKSDYQSFDWVDKPQALALNALQAQSAAGGGGAQARFMGNLGLLKAYATANYPGCCDALGHTVAYGYANGTAQGSFYDTVAVSGAGLATGTAVDYRLDFRIEGTLSSPSFESGGALSADGIAEARLVDLVTRQEVSFRWDAKQKAPGVYSLTLSTQVGHSLAISGMLFAEAYVGSGAATGRSAVANFYNSAGYGLAASVAGLNTVGASGHDYLVSSVPEASALQLGAAGLLVLGARGAMQRRRRAGSRFSPDA